MTTTHSTPVNAEPTAKPDDKKPIELVRFIDANTSCHFTDAVILTSSDPADWNHLRLVIKGDRNEFDVIAAWDDDSPRSPALYLGWWNDGVVG
jgi:hypothetical protein